jgi:HEXXH motif-containing protein
VETDDEDFGASTFQLWGALFLKVRPQSDRVEIAEALAHEGAHALLFGLGMGKPLVRNGTETRYSSPLRKDPRPMDGVVHASYVLGRMHYAVTRLLESGLLTEEEEAGALAAKKRSARHHADSWSVIDPAVQWTPAGEAALAAARAYMAGAG